MAKKPKHESLLKRVRDGYDEFMRCWDKQREHAREDSLLMANKPFTEAEVKRRGKNRSLVLSEPVGQYTNQIVNGIKQNPRGVNMSPMHFATDREETLRRENMARGIERDSDAQAAYSTAFEGAVAYGGMGFMRLTQEYESCDSADQVLRIVRVANQFSILPDPYCKKIDFSDMKRCFVLDKCKHSQFQADWPEAEHKEFDAATKAEYPTWIQDDDMMIAEYWEVEYRPDTVLILADSTILEKELPEGAVYVPTDAKRPQKGGVIIYSDALPPANVIKTRPTKIPRVMQYFTNGVEILKEYEWADKSDSIPIYPVVGREMWVDDGGGPKKQYVSAVRFCSWAVRGMAYVRSLQIELAQMTPKTPYMAIAGQLEGMPGWKSLHTDPAAYVYYRAKLDEFGEAILPPPGRVPFDPPIQQLELLHQAFNADLQNALGMYRASVGNQQGSNSGKMVQELDKQSDAGQFHFIHNYNQTLERLWTDINNKMDEVYDTARDVTGVRKDGTDEVLRLNDPANKKSLHMGRGKFAVSISVGPAMESETDDERRLAEVLAKDPTVMQRAGDLVVKLVSKGPVIDEIAARLKPPGLEDAESTPEEMQRKLMEQAQQLQMAQQQLSEAAKIIETKQIENEAKMREAELKEAAETARNTQDNETAIQVALIREQGAAKREEEKQAAAMAGKVVAIDHQSEDAEAAREHQLEMQGRQQAHEAVMQPEDEEPEAGEDS
jgi:hypothetical protein